METRISSWSMMSRCFARGTESKWVQCRQWQTPSFWRKREICPKRCRKLGYPKVSRLGYFLCVYANKFFYHLDWRSYQEQWNVWSGHNLITIFFFFFFLNKNQNWLCLQESVPESSVDWEYFNSVYPSEEGYNLVVNRTWKYDERVEEGRLI